MSTEYLDIRALRMGIEGVRDGMMWSTTSLKSKPFFVVPDKG
jgi:hypothetical protein